MVKAVYSQSKGLVQESGGFSFVWDAGPVKYERKLLTATINTANGDTVTDTGITPPANARALAYNIEVLSATDRPSGNITSLGYKGGDVDAITGALTIAANAASSNPGNAVTASDYLSATELSVSHGNPDGAGKSSEIRVSLLIETVVA